MLEQDPANTFARYGLATELKNTGDLAGAVHQFELLLQTNARYSAAYVHGGQTTLNGGTAYGFGWSRPVSEETTRMVVIKYLVP